MKEAMNTNFLGSLHELEPLKVLEFAKYHWGLILASLVILTLLRTRFNSLSGLPGPEIAKYTKLWRAYDVYRGEAHWTHIRLHRNTRAQGKGDLVRIGPNHVSVGDPSMIPVIYGLKRKFKKTSFYPLFCITWHKKPEMNLFSETNEDYHREQMRLVGTAYSVSSLLEMEKAIDGCSQLMLQQLDKLAGTPIDLGLWLQFYTFDVIGEVTFNSRLGFLESGDDVGGMMSALRDILKYISIVGEVPELHSFLLGNPVLPYILPSMQTWDKVLQFTLKIVNERTTLKRDGEIMTNGVNEGNDMLTKWCNSKDEDKMTTRDIMVHLTANVFAGSDTTAIALRAILYYLIRDPARYSKATKEVDEAYKSGNLSECIQYKEAQQFLPYISACIQEGLRIHPSVGLTLERYVPKGGATICGREFKEGTIVGINAWVVHRDERVFENPDEFIPERWIDSSKEKLKKMEKSMFAFAFGARACVGRHLALIEMSKLIPTLLLKYEIRMADPEKEWTTSNEWFVQQDGLDCVLTRRTNDERMTSEASHE